MSPITAVPSRPEVELLLLCGRVQMDDFAARRIEALLSGELDWSYLVTTAQRHGILPLLSHHLRAAGDARVPAAVLRQLREASAALADRNRRLTEALVDLLRDFDGAGIPALPFKGPTLALSAYGDLALRPFSDLDLLVRPEDVSRSVELLGVRGYQQMRELSGAQKRAHDRFQYSTSLRRPVDHVTVDLHWAFARRGISARLGPEAALAETVSVALPDGPARTLAPEILLLVLCWHGAKHGPAPWPRVLWICDVAQVIRSNVPLAWPRVLRQARRTGSRRVLGLGLTLARDLLDAPVPDRCAEIVSDPVVEELATAIRDRILRDSLERLPLRARIRFDLTLRESARDRLAYALARLFLPGPRDWTVLRLPGYLAPLYVPLRLLRLAVQHTMRLGRRVRSRLTSA